MTSSADTSGSRYLSLRDYLRVLRRYRLMIVLIAIIGAAAGYAEAKRQTPVYNATSTVAFEDPTQNLSIVGLATSSNETPAQLAAIAAETVTRPTLMIAVKSQLNTPLPVSALSSSVGAVVSQSSGLLDITAAGATPQFAAALANAVADQLVAQENHATQLQFAAIAADVRNRIAALSASHSTSPVDSTQLAVYQDELARLATLSAFAKSAQVAEPAQPPGAASSPKVLRSTVIGLILGLLLGLAAAFVRHAMDRRLRNRQDVSESFRLPVIGHVRNKAMGAIVQTQHGSLKDAAIDLEAFRIVRRNLEFLDSDRSTRTVLVTSALPEEGKTTVAGSLAFALASAARKTLLVDCDLRRPALASRLGIEPTPGITDYLEGKASPEQILRQVQFSDPSAANGASPNGTAAAAPGHSVVFIPAGSRTARAAELLGSVRFKEFLDEVSQVYDVVVLDSSPLLPVADTLEILPHVDGLIVCARERQTTRDQARAARAALSRFPERPTGVVVTGVDPRQNEYDVYEYGYGYN
jgi:Mrp family chromosome partitioning ATPase